ncbi:hypothetical protein ACFVFH_15500 [Streptomyces sp. NPDC057697]|uniref:MmyB family transcriptional regulator n=1 Tax=Streptomyces sp. NPDC057697 TaxID=3346219 RepID=UPI0036AC4026
MTGSARLRELGEFFRHRRGELTPAQVGLPGHRVAHQYFGSKRVTHSTVGELTLDWDTFRYAGAPEQQLVLWSAEPGTPDAERLADPARGTVRSP